MRVRVPPGRPGRFQMLETRVVDEIESNERQRFNVLCDEIERRFTSGNSVPVRDIRLTYDEWQRIALVLKRNALGW